MLLRSLFRTRLLTTGAVLCLSVAIAAATAVFTVVDIAVVHATPFANADRLLAIWSVDPGRDDVRRGLSWPDARDLGRTATSFEALAAMSNANSGMTLTGRGDPVQIPFRIVSGNFFDVLGVRPAAGRVTGTDDDRPGSTAVIVLADQLWRERFGADPGVVGTAAIFDGRPFVIAGVMPAWFAYPRDAQAWATIAHAVPEYADNRNAGWLEAIGLSRPGMTIDQHQAALTPAFDQLTRTFHPLRGKEGLAMQPLDRELLGDVRPAMWAMFAAVFILLAAACANVGGLLLVRGMDRARDVALRVALGANRADIVRSTVAESAVLAMLGGLGGITLSLWLLRVIQTIAPPDLPRRADLVVNWHTLAFALAIVTVTAIACALAPTLHALSVDAQVILQRRGRSVARTRSWARTALISAQIALAVVLIVAAALVGQTLMKLRQIDAGFAADAVLAFDVPLPDTRYPTTKESRAFTDRLLTSLAGVPGVQQSAAVLLRPLWGRVGMDWPMTIEGQPEVEAARNPLTNLEAVSVGYFATLDVPLLDGRDFTAGDRDGDTPVAIVGESFAKRFWPGRTALGRRMKFPLPNSPNHQQWFTVVGVVGDARYRGMRDPRLDLYISAAQCPYPVHQFVVRSSADPSTLLNPVRAAVRAIDPALPVDDATVLREAIDKEMTGPAFTATVFMTFAGVTLGLAALGLGSFIAWQVRQRTREMGIRLALGARPSELVSLLMRESAWIVTVGVGLGLLASILLTRLVQALLFEVHPLDPAALAAGVVITATLGLLGAYIPARRIGRLTPLTALGEE
jgi:predicted permease